MGIKQVGDLMIECTWIPDLELCGDLSRFREYENHIYQIFRNDFINSYPCFDAKRVKIRYEPIEYGKEESFFHVTCQDYAKNRQRNPDLRRCERIRWVRSFIENHACDSSACEFCDGIKIWDEQYKSNLRTHILLEEERYMVVVEKRPTYCLLITAFFFDKDHQLRKTLQRYYRAISA